MIVMKIRNKSSTTLPIITLFIIFRLLKEAEETFKRICLIKTLGMCLKHKKWLSRPLRRSIRRNLLSNLQKFKKTIIPTFSRSLVILQMNKSLTSKEHRKTSILKNREKTVPLSPCKILL